MTCRQSPCHDLDAEGSQKTSKEIQHIIVADDGYGGLPKGLGWGSEVYSILFVFQHRFNLFHTVQLLSAQDNKNCSLRIVAVPTKSMIVQS